MEHVAIDLGGRESQICVRSADGRILDEARLGNGALRKYLGTRPKSRVIVETSAEAFAVADLALELGHEVRVVPSTLAPSLGVGANRKKTDRKDARLLSEVSTRVDLPSVHIPSKRSRARKSACGAREALVRARTLLINNTRGWMRTQGLKVRCESERFADKLRETCADLPSWIRRTLEVLDELNSQIREADNELRQQVRNDDLCSRLTTVPGVGPVTAIRFAAALDEVGRFPHAHSVEAYLGLVPGIWQSGSRSQGLGITKAGSPELRRTLIQAAWSARNQRGRHPMVDWALEVEKRRGKQIATVALARKLVGILYAIWRDGSTYNPLRTNRPPVPSAAGGVKGERPSAVATRPLTPSSPTAEGS